MVDPSTDEYALWHRPSDVLARLGAAGEAASKRIIEQILDCRIRIVGQDLGKADGVSQRSLIDLSYFDGPWVPNWKEFWSSGEVSFVHNPTMLKGFAALKIDGLAESLCQPDIHIFREVRLDPDAMVSEFDLDPLPEPAVPQREELPPVRKGGRPAGKGGAPIASITKRMLAKSAEELQRYKVEVLMLELIDEYRKQGFAPPSEANARREAAGILSIVRE